MKGNTTLKTRLLILVAAFVSAAFVLLLIVGLLQSKEARASGPTYVSGGIFTDTIWSASQSPYIVTATVVVFPDNKLTIEPGVEVRFAGSTDLIIRGRLVARGTASNRIVFTSNSSNPSEGSWGGIDIDDSLGGNISIKFANISFAELGLTGAGPLNISDCVFSNNRYALGFSNGKVERCTFENTTFTAMQGSYNVISNSFFRNNRIALFNLKSARVYTSVFVNNDRAFVVGDGEVRGSKIFNNGIGVDRGRYHLFQNTIANNGIGVVFEEGAVIEYNNIYNNTEHNIRSSLSTNKDASHNWWGTIDTAAIEEGIYDGRDDPLLGLINYQPFLQSPQDDGWRSVLLPLVTNQP